MIGVGEGQGRTASVTEALDMLHRALDHLNAADAASLPASVQAEALRALERAGAKQTAARARMLGAFAGQAAYEDDGQGSARTWLRSRPGRSRPRRMARQPSAGFSSTIVSR